MKIGAERDGKTVTVYPIAFMVALLVAGILAAWLHRVRLDARKLRADLMEKADALSRTTEELEQTKADKAATVTERNEALEELERRESLLNEMGRTAFIGGWEADLVTGDMEWTEIVYQMHEVPLGVDPPADQVVEFYHPDFRDEIRALTIEALRSGESFDTEAILVGAKGTERWVRLICTTRRVDGRTVKLVGTLQDITEQKEAESDMRRREEEEDRLRTQLIQAQKMESVGQLAGGIAHDFNNALQAIVGHAELGASDQPEGAQARQHFDEIKLASEHAGGLVRQLLAFGRRQVLELTDVDLNLLLADLSRMVQRIIGEHIALRFVPCEGPLMVRADRGQLEQVVVNLCVNARDAMGARGVLTIRTDRTDTPVGDDSTGGPKGQLAVIRVLDDGCGMDADTLDRIFEPFFSTKDPEVGTGLGLSTVFGIVHQHGGRVDVQSTPGQGSTFEVFLPTILAASAPARIPKTAEVPGGSETILVADDEEFVREVTVAQLADGGYSVIEATDGESAVRQFDAHADSIQLAVLDVVMPNGGGKAVAEHIADRHPGLPILFCSGYSEQGIHMDFILPNGTNLIQKPYTRADLLTRVRTLLDEHPGQED